MNTKALQKIADANTLTASASTASARKVRRVLSVVLTIALMVALIGCLAFAAPEDGVSNIEVGVKTGLKSIYSLLTKIVVPVAVVAIAFAAYQIFTGGERGMQTAKQIILYTVIGVAIVYLAPLLITSASDWFSDSSSSSVDVAFGQQ